MLLSIRFSGELVPVLEVWSEYLVLYLQNLNFKRLDADQPIEALVELHLG